MKRLPLRWRWLLCSFAAAAAVLLFYFGGAALLSCLGIQWRPRIRTAAFFLLILAGNSGVMALITVLYRAGKRFRWWHIVVKGIPTLALCAFLVFANYMAFLAAVFSYEPEHVMEKNGQKSVACVRSFLSVYVDYYQYQSPFTMSKELLTCEYYGDGGYDPFDGDHDEYQPAE